MKGGFGISNVIVVVSGFGNFFAANYVVFFSHVFVIMFHIVILK